MSNSAKLSAAWLIDRNAESVQAIGDAEFDLNAARSSGEGPAIEAATRRYDLAVEQWYTDRRDITHALAYQLRVALQTDASLITPLLAELLRPELEALAKAITGAKTE